LTHPLFLFVQMEEISYLCRTEIKQE